MDPAQAEPSGRLVGVRGVPGRGIVTSYVAAVGVSGLGLLVALAAFKGARDIARVPAEFWLFTFFILAGELFPIRMQRRDEVDEVTTSTTFAFAVMLGYGTALAALALATSSIVGDVAHRKPAWKSVFNIAQYTLSIGAAGGVYHALAPGPSITAGGLWAVLAAAVVFFVLNTLVTGVAVGLAQGAPLPRYVAHDFVLQAYTAPALLALSPIVVVTAERSLWFVPLLAVPIVAVYWGATVSLENVRLVASLKGSLEHLTELNRLKDDFVAVVSHELRTPLTSIQGYVKTLLQLGGGLDEEQRRSFLEAADRQSERLRRMIEQTLVVARLESHVEPLSVSHASLPVLARHVVKELEPRAHGHTFDLRFPSDLERVETDESKVHQILSNLVENALKYSPPDTRITISAKGRTEGVVISVADEGPGIPLEAREKVFDRFYQVDQSSTRSVGGTGLGLYICRKLAEAIGAQLWLEEQEHGGSIFNLLIPLAQPADLLDSAADIARADSGLRVYGNHAD